MAKRLSNFHNRLILSYGLLVVLVIFLSVTIADAFFIRLFRTFLAGRYGLPFGVDSPVVEPDSYLVTETFARFHEVMHLSLWIGGAVVMLLALVLAGWFTRRLSRPIVGYAQFADKVGRGDYGVQLSDTGGMVEFAELADSLNRMARDLRCKDEIERELFSNLSHELRTPVTVIKGYAEAMDGGVITDPGEIHAATQAIAQETVNLESMINELRQLAQIDNNAVHPEPSQFVLDDLLLYIWRRFAPQALARHVELTRDLHAGVNVFLDRQLVDRAIANILGNAVGANPEGHSVTLSSSSDEHRVTIVVDDTASGISETDLAHIFERFFRGDRSRNRKSGGLGLGLPIARDLIEIEHGTIDVRSRMGVGTRVTVTYPLIARGPTNRVRASLHRSTTPIH